MFEAVAAGRHGATKSALLNERAFPDTLNGLAQAAAGPMQVIENQTYDDA